MKIFGLGMPELLIILGVALLIFGPKHLPKLGSALGKTIKNLREGFDSGDGVIKGAAAEDGEEEQAPRRKKKQMKRIETADAEDDAARAKEEAATA